MRASMDDVDVAIVGAGLSGVGAAAQLRRRCPSTSFALLEARQAMGGTWDLFRYPGIRSDSDMFTLGYGFKPWIGDQAIADGPSIKRYIEEAADEYDVRRHIRFGHRVVAADWHSDGARWHVKAETNGGETVIVRCRFLYLCNGYYRYDQGHAPHFEGQERFAGPIVHPQHWPEQLDYRGKRVVVIGSGATAVTLVPAMAVDAQKVTMLQRSPTYVVSAPGRDPIARLLGSVLPAAWVYVILRWLKAKLQGFFYRRARKDPANARQRLIDAVRDELGPNFDVETHFSPRYNPWDQRLCLVPDSDLFEVIRAGRAAVVTDTIAHFTETGIALTSGRELEADIIVTATGLELLVLGGMGFSLDGEPVDFAETYTYKGMMYSGVPNLASTFGYINASWTLRADLTAEFVCRVLTHMRDRGSEVCVPQLRAGEQDMARRPWITEFTPGYMQRSMHLFPAQGDHEPWINPQDYQRDKKMIRHGRLDDGVLCFRNAD
ncbi:MAG: NAD(P)/FAD-dependent oxidoreductase [Myxococcales bacterium]|nr:NAD(P)/FAD-dependent oxidoreductase [Myxococcales bacterium]